MRVDRTVVRRGGAADGDHRLEPHFERAKVVQDACDALDPCRIFVAQGHVRVQRLNADAVRRWKQGDCASGLLEGSRDARQIVVKMIHDPQGAAGQGFVLQPGDSGKNRIRVRVAIPAGEFSQEPPAARGFHYGSLDGGEIRLGKINILGRDERLLIGHGIVIATRLLIPGACPGSLGWLVEAVPIPALGCQCVESSQQLNTFRCVINALSRLRLRFSAVRTF